MQGRFGTSLDPQLGTDRSCSAHKRTPLLQCGYSPGTTDEVKYCKNQGFAEGQQRRSYTGHFCSTFGHKTGICRGLCWSHRQAFVPKSHATAGSGWGGCWRGDTAHRALTATCCQSPVAQCHPSSSSPRLCRCWDTVMVFLSSSALTSSFV